MSYKSGHSFNDIQTVTGTINLSSIYSTVLADASGGAVTLNLPAAATYAEITFTIKAIDVTNTVTVTPNGVETIDGSTGSIALSLNESITIQSDGTKWVRLDIDTSVSYTAAEGLSLSGTEFQLGTTTQNDATQAFTADRYINLDAFDLEFESTNSDTAPTLTLKSNGDVLFGASEQANIAFTTGLSWDKSKGAFAAGRFNAVDITGLGDRATNFGDRNTVTGYSSFAAGVTNTASGGYSTAIGANNVSSADGSISLGGGLEPTAFSSVYAGMNATIAAGQTAGSFVSTDEIFKIGIGASTAARADGLIMTKDGKLRLPTYGVNTNTGTAAYSLQVDASGNVIEGSISTESTTADNGVSLSGTAVQLGHAASGTGASDFTANRYLYTNTFDLEVGNAVDANNFYIDASNGKIGIGVVPTGSADFGKLTINKQTGDAFPNLTLYEGAVYLKGDVDSSTAKTSLTSNGGITLNAGAAGGSSIVLESSQTAANSIYFTTKDGTYDIETSASFLNTIEYSHTPTTGAFEHSSLYIIPTINQTGTAAGIVSGVKLKPVLTALGGTYRGIDLAFNNANAYGVYQTGALTSNYYEGVNIFNGYGLGVREAADLSKTDSGYLAGFATDGTIIEVTPTTATSSFYNTGTTTFNEDTTTAAFRTGQTAFGADTFNGTRAVTITGFSSINDGNNSTYITGGNTNATGSSNIAIGYRSAESNLTGISNTYIGVESGLSNTSSFNTVLGASAYDGTSNTGNTNTVIGYRALRAPNFSGTNNIVIGATTVGAATTATSNVVVGNSSGSSLTSGNLNTLLGSNTGTALTTGANNTIVGRQSGQNITTGTDNIVIGSNVDGISATGNYELNIGNGIFGTGFDNAGSGANSGSLVGIRNSAPTAALHVTGVGATSATTALLVENSVGTDALTVDDVGTIEFNIYGLGNKEAADLTKTSSGYGAVFATDGTIIEELGGASLANNGVSKLASTGAIQLGQAAAGSGDANFTANRYQYLNGFDYEFGTSTLNTAFYPAFSVQDSMDVWMGSRATNVAGGVPIFFFDHSQGSFYLGTASNAVTYLDAIGTDAVGLGTDALASGANSVAMAFSTASGERSFAQGSSTASNSRSAAFAGSTASGDRAVSGAGATASGQLSTSFGNSLSSGTNSFSAAIGTAVGINSASFRGTATGDESFAHGVDVESQSSNSVALGLSSVVLTAQTTSGWVANDSIFTVSNGNNVTANLITGLKNGFTQFNGFGGGAAQTEAEALPRAEVEVRGTGSIILPIGTTAQRPTVPAYGKAVADEGSSTAGMIRYNSDLACVESYNGTTWVCLSDESSAFYNTGTTTATTDTTTSAFRTGQLALGADTFVGTRQLTVTGTASVLDANSNTFISGGNETTTASNNTAVGQQSLIANTTGNSNTAIGIQTMFRNTTGATNVAVGSQSLLNNTIGSSNVAIGNQSLTSNISGDNNVGIGFQALFTNDTGFDNVAIGREALEFNTTGAANVAVGSNALTANTIGGGNVAIGDSALIASTTADSNVAIGNFSLFSNVTGTGNVAVGYNTLLQNTASENTAIGYASLSSNTTATNNTAIGHSSLTSTTTGGFNTAVGDQSLEFNTTGIVNVAIGASALRNNTSGDSNTAVGVVALTANTTGQYNTSVGRQSLEANTTARFNTAMGYQALQDNTTAEGNTAFGYQAANGNTTGTGIVAIGFQTLLDNTANNNTAVGSLALTSATTGGFNVAVGTNALKTSTTAFNNTAIGNQALEFTTGNNNTATGAYVLAANTTGSGNVGVGHQALISNVDGADNVAVGKDTLDANTSGNYNIALGTLALTSATTADYNTGVGYSALLNTITGTQNVSLGAFAGQAMTGSRGTFVGYAAGNGNTASNTVAVGWRALQNNTTGDSNVAVGANSLATNIIGTSNTAVGGAALQVSTGDNNTAVGTSALTLLTTGEDNTAIGRLSQNLATTGFRNTSLGAQTFGGVLTGTDNIGIGYVAGRDLTSGSDNVLIGSNAGLQLTTADGNTMVGHEAGRATTTGGTNSYFGYQSGYAGVVNTGNVAVGYQSLYTSTASSNTAVGYQSLLTNTTGSFNTAVGFQALNSNVTGGANTSLGYRALLTYTGFNGTALGYNTLASNSTGAGNTAVGSNVMSLVTTGASNVGVGAFTLNSLITGSNNTALGLQALKANLQSNNTAVGTDSFLINTEGSGNVGIGYNTATTNLVGSNNIIIGKAVDTTRVTTDNELNIGGVIGSEDMTIGSVHLDFYGLGNMEAVDLSTRTLTSLGVATTSETLATSTIVFAAVHGLTTSDIIRFESGANNTADLTVTVVDTTTITVTPALNADDSGNTPFIVTTPGKTDSGYLAGFATDGTVIEVSNGGAANIYVGDGTLTSNRTVNAGTNELFFTNAERIRFNANNTATTSDFDVSAQVITTSSATSTSLTSGGTFTAGYSVAPNVHSVDATSTSIGLSSTDGTDTATVALTTTTITNTAEAIITAGRKVHTNVQSETSAVDVNNLTLTSNVSILEVNATAAIILSGMIPQSLTERIEMIIMNTGTADLTVGHEDTNSTSATRFQLVNNTSLAIRPNGMVTALYLPASNRWRLMTQ